MFKKLIKEIGFISIILVICFSLMGAAPCNNVIEKRQSISDLKEDFLKETTSKIGLSEVREIKNIQNFKSIIKKNYPKMSDMELAKNILLNVGYKENEVEQMPEHALRDALTYESAFLTDTYYKINEKKEKIIVSKEESMAAVETENQKSNASNNVVDDQVSFDNNLNIQSVLPNPEESNTDDYLRLTSGAFKVNDGSLSNRSYFIVFSSAEWLIIPNYKMEDILVVASDGNIDQDYDHFGSFYENITCKQTSLCGNNHCKTEIVSELVSKGSPVSANASIITKSAHAVTLNFNVGATVCPVHNYYDFSDGSSHTTTYNSITAFVQYRVVLDHDASCIGAYSHKYFGISGVDVSVGLPLSVSFTPGFSTMIDEFYTPGFTIFHNVPYEE